jgi:single-stranded-DNA-specific exonuclease
MQEKQWHIAMVDEAKVQSLKEALGIHPILCQLLINRGIESYDDAYRFFRPKLSQLHDPFLMDGMQKAVQRIIQAIESEQRILIYGDYDVDGTTAVSALLLYFRNFYDHVGFYIPNRYTEGYGISYQGIDYAEEHQYPLVIALDCGIQAKEQIAYANEKGIDFIVCDHHLPGEELPPAYAILDPKKPGCSYPFKELPGCGIGLKLIHALIQMLDQPLEWMYDLLDLGVISIAADIVPITGENRIIAHYGLKKISKKPLPGVRILMELAQVRPPVSISNIVFGLAPRINAAGRIDDARDAVKMLTGQENEDTYTSAELLHNHNNDRRNLDKTITEAALVQIQNDSYFEEAHTTIVYDADWHKGVIGIVASRLIETHYRPTIVFTEREGILTGSARSVRGFNIHQALAECSDLLENFGGHKYAAGMALKKENFEPFKKKFDKVVKASITEDCLQPAIEADAELHLAQINGGFFKILKQFAPYGPGNPNPIFVARNVRDRGYARIVGEDHLKMTLHQDESNYFGAIAFGQARQLEIVKERKPVDICFHVEENEYQGTVTLQLNVKDIKPSEV